MKWRLLRDTYVRYKKRHVAGSQRDWKYSDVLCYLDPYLLHRRSV